MKIMIDATSLARKITGIENYTKNLIYNISSIISPNHELYLLFRKEIPDHFINIPGVKALKSPFDSQILCEQLWIPYIKLKIKPDIIHFPAFPPSFFCFKNVVFTLHDATMWKFPETTSLKNKLYMRPLSKKGVKKAKKVLTVSNCSLQEINSIFPQYKEKVINTGISISDEFYKTTNIEKLEKIREKYNLPSQFFLTVGSLEPRKNLKFLIEVVSDLIKDHPSCNLVITGRSAWGSEEINKLVKEKKLENNITFTGYIPDEDLIGLYQMAYYFICPSIYEGFGLPVLEAMACGTPVILANTSSLPEVADYAGLYFNPTIKEELIAILYKIYGNSAFRKEMAIKAKQRSFDFSWKAVADNIMNEYVSD
jgi:glycosyltransferase involved in cell wall biosynthesis